MRQFLISAVDKAHGWQFLPDHQLVKIPGFTEPVSLMKMHTVARDALAAQLVRQIDGKSGWSFSASQIGGVTIVHGEVVSYCSKSPSRTENAFLAIQKSGFVK